MENVFDCKQVMTKNDLKSHSINSFSDTMCSSNNNEELEEYGNTLKKNKKPTNNYMMPLSYIGQAFLANNIKYEEESNAIFKEISDLQHKEECAELYLPNIIGSLCKRINDLENRLQK